MIKANVKAENPDATLKNYEETRKNFSWQKIEEYFSWHESGKMNIVYEAIDRWAEHPLKKDHTALVFEKGGNNFPYSYKELKKKSCQWASLLKSKGFKKGDRFFIFVPHCPQFYMAMLGCCRIGVIFCPLYSTLGYEEIEDRIKNAEPKGILTHPDLAEKLPVEAMDSVEYLFYTEGPLPDIIKNEIMIDEFLCKMEEEYEPEWVQKNTPLYLIYTSGSTGPPKGVIHAHGDMTAQYISAKYALDIKEDTVLWTDCDPAWVTGTVYSTFAPWLCGATSVVQGGIFLASTWYQTLERYKIEVWYTTPMTLLKLMEAGDDLPTRYNFSHLRHIATVGRALVPELFYWAKKNLNHSIHDTWWMTETGSIGIASFASMDLKVGSIGKPMPGFEFAIIDENGNPLPFMTMGELAIKMPWPSMMTGLWRDEKRFREYFRNNGWFSTGDMALINEEGFYFHQGRMDDLIKVGEKLIGPYDIEQVLYQHPAVKEAAVIALSTESISPQLKAFISIEKDLPRSKRLNQEIKAFVKARLSPETPLNEIVFMDQLPKTESGKLLRRVLRAMELGLPG